MGAMSPHAGLVSLLHPPGLRMWGPESDCLGSNPALHFTAQESGTHPRVLCLSFPICEVGIMLLQHNELERRKFMGNAQKGECRPGRRGGGGLRCCPPAETGRVANRALVAVPRSPGRDLFLYSGSFQSKGCCPSITSGPPLPGPCLSPLLLFPPLGSRILVVPVCSNRLCFLKMTK